MHHYLFQRFCSEFSCLSLDACFALWAKHGSYCSIRLFMLNIICDVLIGWSCSGTCWPKSLYPLRTFVTWNSLVKTTRIRHLERKKRQNQDRDLTTPQTTTGLPSFYLHSDTGHGSCATEAGTVVAIQWYFDRQTINWICYCHAWWGLIALYFQRL